MHQRMTIERAEHVVSQQLGCAIGSPVAKMLRQLYGADRRLSYAGLSWYRGDSFEMDMTLPRALIEDSSPALIAPGIRTREP
jgi:GntR family transcriptional regulator